MSVSDGAYGQKVCVVGLEDVAASVKDRIDAMGIESIMLDERSCVHKNLELYLSNKEMFVIVDARLGFGWVDRACATSRLASIDCKLVLLITGKSNYTASYLRDGFFGFVRLSDFEDDMKKCLCVLSNGGIYARIEDISRIFFDYLLDDARGAIALREREIAFGIVCGKTYKEIAAELSINYRSLVTYVTEIRRRNSLAGGRARVVEYFRSTIA